MGLKEDGERRNLKEVNNGPVNLYQSSVSLKKNIIQGPARLIAGLLLLVFSWGCVSLPVSAPGTKPVITHAFIDKEQGIYGSILKIYIEGDDPQGFMFSIATSVDQVGYGHYLADWVYLEPPFQHHVIGYLQWNTFSYHASWMPEWTQLTIKVSIFDTNGNESNEVVFPFEFVSQAVPESPLPPPFDQPNLPRLGYIAIDLFNPSQMGDDHDRLFR